MITTYIIKELVKIRNANERLTEDIHYKDNFEPCPDLSGIENDSKAITENINKLIYEIEQIELKLEGK